MYINDWVNIWFYGITINSVKLWKTTNGKKENIKV